MKDHVFAVAGEDASARWKIIDLTWHENHQAWWVTIQRVDRRYFTQKGCPMSDLRPVYQQVRFDVNDTQEITDQLRRGETA